MSLTYTEARDEIVDLFVDAWRALGAPTENVTLLFEDKLESGRTGDTDSHVPDAEAPWGYLRVAWGRARQSAHGDAEKLYTRRGTLILLVKTKPGDGQTIMDRIVQMVADAVEGKTTPGGVRFEDFDPKGFGHAGGSTKIISMPFEFDQRK
mgnify:CR=1 FL=1